MKIEMYLYLNPEQLSTYKTNIIKPQLEKNGPYIGEVESITEEYYDNIYKCAVSIYPHMEKIVFEAMSKEQKKLTG